MELVGWIIKIKMRDKTVARARKAKSICTADIATGLLTPYILTSLYCGHDRRRAEGAIFFGYHRHFAKADRQYRPDLAQPVPDTIWCEKLPKPWID